MVAKQIKKWLKGVPDSARIEVKNGRNWNDVEAEDLRSVMEPGKRGAGRAHSRRRRKRRKDAGKPRGSRTKRKERKAKRAAKTQRQPRQTEATL